MNQEDTSPRRVRHSRSCNVGGQPSCGLGMVSRSGSRWGRRWRGRVPPRSGCPRRGGVRRGHGTDARCPALWMPPKVDRAASTNRPLHAQVPAVQAHGPSARWAGPALVCPPCYIPLRSLSASAKRRKSRRLMRILEPSGSLLSRIAMLPWRAANSTQASPCSLLRAALRHAASRAFYVPHDLADCQYL